MAQQIQDAEGGILFVDEAYRLIPMQKSDDKDYGLEALEEIMSVMDSGKIVVIFAGYCEPMKRVIASNDGFCRRVTKFFYFDDFSTTELAEILHMKMKSPSESSLLYGFKLHPSCSIEVIGELIARETTEERRKQMNGGLVDTLHINAVTCKFNRIVFLIISCLSPKMKLCLTMTGFHPSFLVILSVVSSHC